MIQIPLKSEKMTKYSQKYPKMSQKTLKYHAQSLLKRKYILEMLDRIHWEKVGMFRNFIHD